MGVYPWGKSIRAYGNNVEKLFSVLPGENPEIIKIKLQGAKGLEVNEAGELEVITELGPVKFTKPIAYQEIESKRIEITAAYNIQESEVGSRQSSIPNLKVHPLPYALCPLPFQTASKLANTTITTHSS